MVEPDIVKTRIMGTRSETIWQIINNEDLEIHHKYEVQLFHCKKGWIERTNEVLGTCSYNFHEIESKVIFLEEWKDGEVVI